MKSSRPVLSSADIPFQLCPMPSQKTVSLLRPSLLALCVTVASSIAQAEYFGLGYLPNGSSYSGAIGVSPDGSVVVGNSDSADGWEAFRWTQAGGMQGLGYLPGGHHDSWAVGVSADGSVVAGSSDGAGIHSEAFRWTQAGGMQALGDLPGGSYFSDAFGISADGAVVVGFSVSASGGEAFRWTQATGMQGLGYLPGGGSDSFANAASNDGSVVVGDSNSANSYQEAFRWTQVKGMQSLSTWLQDNGIDSSDWHFQSATAVSADGSTVIGHGYHLGRT